MDIIGALGRTDPVFAAERRRHIAEYVAGRGRARIGELAELFAVTEQTVRKDLRELDQAGVLKRTYGGVLAIEPIDREPAAGEAADEEVGQGVARACVELLRDGNAAFLDGSPAGRSIAHALARVQRREPAGRRSLTVLTNAPDVLQEVAGAPSVQHVLVGGQLDPQSGALVGPLAIENLRRFKVDVAFVGAGGLSADGLSVATVADAEVKRAIIERARHVVVPFAAASTGATDFAEVCPLGAVGTVVADGESAELRALCEAAGVQLVVAD